MDTSVPVLLLTGTVGVGKTTLLYEIADVLSEMEIPNGAIDLDALTTLWPPSSRWNADLMFESLASLWPSYRSRGASRLVLAHVLEDGTEKDLYREAVPGAQLQVVRLVAPERTRLKRLRERMPAGPGLDWHLARTTELEAILDAAQHEDFVVDNSDRPTREVAMELLQRAGWLGTR